MLILTTDRDFERLEQTVSLLTTYVRLSLKMEFRMSKEMDDLATEVSEDTDVMSSALKLLDELAVKIANAGTDPAKLQALTTDLMNSRESLAAAIKANTPADTAPAADPATPADVPPVDTAPAPSDTPPTP